MKKMVLDYLVIPAFVKSPQAAITPVALKVTIVYIRISFIPKGYSGFNNPENEMFFQSVPESP